jgi:hypothetical protein
MILNQRKSSVNHLREQREVTDDIQSDNEIINQGNLSGCRGDEILSVTLVAQVKISELTDMENHQMETVIK